jgi:hypothetical protein
MKIRLSLCVLLMWTAAIASAAPEITSVDPPQGFPAGGTLVTLHGTELSTASVNCAFSCNAGTCPSSVLFGTTPAEVQSVHPNRVVVIAPPHDPATVNVIIRTAGRGEIVKQAAFTYADDAVTHVGDYVRYLIPISVHQLHGALGSIWESELTILNTDRRAMTVIAPWCQTAAACQPPSYPPQVSVREELEGRSGGGDGSFLYVPRAVREELSMQLRVRDTSRVAEGFGTEVPVVPQEEFGATQHLIDVPTDDRYRATLRVYGERRSDFVRVAVFTPTGILPIEERLIPLQPAIMAGEFMRHPAYVQLDPLTPVVRAAGAQQVIVRVESPILFRGNDERAIWALLSITNNDTQQVTTVTPRQR